MSDYCARDSFDASHIKETSAQLSFADYLGAIKVRCNIGRMNYSVAPGLYRINNPDASSPVLVTANYKLTFDLLRQQLTDIAAWILVLDSQGINVWCASGKGTFGTKELIMRIKEAKLAELLDHQEVILPQLSAVGVAAPMVEKATGFKVIYGPIAAKHIPAFLSSGKKADKKMREIKFTFIDRLILTPVEIVQAAKPTLMILGLVFLLNLLNLTAISSSMVAAFIAAVLAGCFLTPLLLPIIPVRSFALKGWIMGLLVVGIISIVCGWWKSPLGMVSAIGALLALPTASTYYALLFTGSSTYASPSGVAKETPVAIKWIKIFAVTGLIILLFANLFGRGWVNAEIF